MRQPHVPAHDVQFRQHGADVGPLLLRPHPRQIDDHAAIRIPQRAHQLRRCRRRVVSAEHRHARHCLERPVITFRVDDAAAFASLDELASQGRPLPIIPPGAALPDLADVQVLPAAHSRLANGIAPVWAEVVCSTEPAAGELVRLMAGDRLAAVARYAPGRTDGRQGDFVLDKVFPEAFRSA